MANVTSLLNNLDTSMTQLMETIESMKPAYQHAMRMLNSSNANSNEQKNNLVFYGIPPELLEKQMEAEPEFCRDILETRIKTVFRDCLKISRDIPFTHVYRFTTGNPDPDEVRPIVAGFRSLRDKENILRHCTSSKELKKKNIFVTEDFSSKKQRAPVNPLEQVIPVSPTKRSTLPSPKKSPKKKAGRKNNVVGMKDSSSSNNLLDLGRDQMESSAGLSDRMSSCNSDYAPSSNSGHSSSGAFTDD